MSFGPTRQRKNIGSVHSQVVRHYKRPSTVFVVIKERLLKMQRNLIGKCVGDQLSVGIQGIGFVIDGVHRLSAATKYFEKAIALDPDLAQ
jgi:hypothetical protein